MSVSRAETDLAAVDVDDTTPIPVQPHLDVEGISVRFGGLQALDTVSFHVQQYEIVGLMGPNGAGKTTVFNIISGFLEPDAGGIRYRGEDLLALEPHQRASRGFARTFQQVGLVRSMTVLENLITAQHLRAAYNFVDGILSGERSRYEEHALRRRAVQVLGLVGLGHLQDEVLTALPYGTLKMVEVAAVLSTEPKLLLLDEPTSGLSPEESARFGRLLREIRDVLGVTILLIEHHVPLMIEVCDYIYVLNFGRILAHGEADEVRRHPEVLEAYFGEGIAHATA